MFVFCFCGSSPLLLRALPPTLLLVSLFFWVVVFFGFSRLAEADAGCSVVTVGDGSTRAEMSVNGVCV